MAEVWSSISQKVWARKVLSIRRCSCCFNVCYLGDLQLSRSVRSYKSSLIYTLRNLLGTSSSLVPCTDVSWASQHTLVWGEGEHAWRWVGHHSGFSVRKLKWETETQSSMAFISWARLRVLAGRSRWWTEGQLAVQAPLSTLKQLEEICCWEKRFGFSSVMNWWVMKCLNRFRC